MNTHFPIGLPQKHLYLSGTPLQLVAEWVLGWELETGWDWELDLGLVLDWDSQRDLELDSDRRPELE